MSNENDTMTDMQFTDDDFERASDKHSSLICPPCSHNAYSLEEFRESQEESLDCFVDMYGDEGKSFIRMISRLADDGMLGIFDEDDMVPLGASGFMFDGEGKLSIFSRR
uniref:Uncharacterized protein n=1 Tax=Pithovirus LCPAC101 TaxID=2506586 RepID=A0A481Z217_9VIRU|nr:MAG: hypothetical protein LCPAC101_00600 [Pithovirus LCPAC101]